jgi:ketosteroid isomerase-like protein
MRSGLATVVFFLSLFSSLPFPSLLFPQLITTGFPTTSQKAGSAAPASSGETAVELVLRTQQDAWNRHDLEAFMAGYWNSPELTFFSGATERKGWQATIDRYRAAYASPGHEMGQLEFSGLRIEMLGADAAFVRGSWHLTMGDGKTPHGLFTLVFRRFPEGWKIVHDHTSAAE